MIETEVSGSGRGGDGSVVLLHEFFWRSAARWPERVAVEVPPGSGRAGRSHTTYRELAARAERLAQRLGEMGVQVEEVVGILLPRGSSDLYVAQLAVLRVGAAYTCLDRTFPDTRCREVLEDAGVKVLVTDAEGLGRASAGGFGRRRLVGVSGSGRASDEVAGGDPGASEVQGGAPAGGLTDPGGITQGGPERLAYVIYTSGTTGRPKGVMIEHRSIVNLVAGDLAEFGLGPGDRVVQGSSPAYDSSVEECWLAWAAGATLVVMDEEAARLGPDLVGWLRDERVTVFCPPPTLLRATGCEDPRSALPELRLLYVGGEALPREVADRWAVGRRLVNGYGPTECTVTCLRGPVEAGGEITIGRPVPGACAWVLDADMGEVGTGERGELWVGGVGLARGYWNQPGLTAERFVEHARLGRIYRTGDWVLRDEAGDFHYHGRVDGQVKVRGYRIELGAVEAALGRCPGVRAAACQVQDEGGNAVLVGFVVPVEPGKALGLGVLKEALAAVLPTYMVPARMGQLGELPVTVGGKLNRGALPRLEAEVEFADGEVVAPRTSMEEKLARVFREVLGLGRPVSVREHFFSDLGGDSLRAAQVVTRLRADADTAWVTVRDVYEAPRVEDLAGRARGVPTGEPRAEANRERVSARRYWLTAGLQAAWLACGLMVFSVGAVVVVGGLLPWLSERVGWVLFLLMLPVLGAVGLLVYVPVSVAGLVLAKRVLVGRYVPQRVPVWGGFYLRNWMVVSLARLVPWGILEGTEFRCATLRALGARIGRGVHIHRGVNLQQGGWDLIELGDNVAIGQDAALRVVELEDGHLAMGTVAMGDGATMEVRAGMEGNSVMEAGACLAALSALSAGGRIPAGERWDGIPARRVGLASVAPELGKEGKGMGPWAYGVSMVLARVALGLVLALPAEAILVVFSLGLGVREETFWRWLRDPEAMLGPGLLAAMLVMWALPITLGFAALLVRGLGRVPVGVISHRSLGYIRVRLKTGLVDHVGEWLSGTLFWPGWLRLAGMRIGPGCEISTIIDVVPEHVEIGAETFFADGVYLGGARVQAGTVEMAGTRLGTNAFMGNHAVIPAGAQLPGDILLGVCTVADDRVVRPGTAWFGHPPFELLRREVVVCDRRLTHEPSWIRYWNRVFWELLRFTLPIPPLVVGVIWCRALELEKGLGVGWWLGLVPWVTAASGASLCAGVILLKWGLLGRVRPGHHALWSCWCSRWDFLYVAWGRLARPLLANLEGTVWLTWFLRAMGMGLGRRVVLGPGFSQVVDPDMIQIGDEATVNAMFQAHTFEDRVLKIDRVRIGSRATVGSGTVPLYGAEVGEGAQVTSHSVIMKREHLLPGLRYGGAPTRAGMACEQ